MDFVYLLIRGNDWENFVIYLTKEDAINASIQNPTCRVEVFAKNATTPGYNPTYVYYKNGK